jgi:hypothetical protein
MNYFVKQSNLPNILLKKIKYHYSILMLRLKSYNENATADLSSCGIDQPRLEVKQEPGFVKLIRDIKGIENLKAIFEEAINGEFSDFGSSNGMPVTELINAFNSSERSDLAVNAMKGKYDHGWVYFTDDEPSYKVEKEPKKE